MAVSIDPQVLPKPEPELVQTKLRLLEVWSWWLWSAAITILVLVGVWADSRQRILLATVLLFAVFAMYQQVLANRLRRQMAAQRIAELHSRTELLEELSMIDPLTGLFNRRFAFQRLPHEIARAERQNCDMTVLMLDLDNFKAINDSFGHSAGDSALQTFASALRRAIRNADLAVRWGGDEFLVLLPECTAEQVAYPLERLKECAVEFEGTRIPIEFSAGWAQRRGTERAEDILTRADQALYEAKRTRKTAGLTQ